MHVSSVSVSLMLRGRNYHGSALVTVVDSSGSPVADATVTGNWFLNGVEFKTGASGVTGGNGVAEITSGPIKGAASGNIVKFCVTNVAHTSLTYDPGANAATCGQAIVP